MSFLFAALRLLFETEKTGISPSERIFSCHGNYVIKIRLYIPACFLHDPIFADIITASRPSKTISRTPVMAPQLVWDQGFWDSGATWDGMAPTQPSSKMNTKAVIDYSHFTDAELGTTAEAGHNGVAANPTVFATPDPDLATLLTHITAYKDALTQTVMHPGRDATLAKKAARKVLENDLKTLGTYVNLVAKGDADIVALSGLPSYTTGGSAPVVTRSAPTNLSLKQGQNSGSIDFSCKQSVPSDPLEVQTCTGDPNVEANWGGSRTFAASSGTLTGLTPGAVIWVRVRSVIPGGGTTDWSAVENMRVI